MSICIMRGVADPLIEEIVEVLKKYQADRPHAKIDLYRQNSVSVRVRIIDLEFEGLGKVDRHETVWRYLDELPEDIVSDISTLILLTPDEVEHSFANFDFEDPIPSKL